jgi:hypothetical protein
MFTFTLAFLSSLFKQVDKISGVILYLVIPADVLLGVYCGYLGITNEIPILSGVSGISLGVFGAMLIPENRKKHGLIGWGVTFIAGAIAFILAPHREISVLFVTLSILPIVSLIWEALDDWAGGIPQRFESRKKRHV